MTHAEFDIFCTHHADQSDRDLLLMTLACVKDVAQENVRLKQREAELLDTIELVATGGKILCPTCGQFRPCVCDK